MQPDLVTILAVTALFLALCIAYKSIKISFKWNNIEFNIEASREKKEKSDADTSDSQQE
ncbi:hypothetical protein DFP93_101204 [Aneurinibacillus soli]|uniref:Uncharacterized protein n=1 Tax=Aneurinibacillus soli TaxID=1500254 RepID=A0A0U5B1H6_9BACL|nr:hypothetical protein [Aneurinibacillus soli]PYE64179.1 hypothetical protein DFP93_101204 [Aneurinibacillus soli]BAU28128.1 hypothetical protein CB4_02302 [Aneurinibacillus soli]